jgi:hypothetical protein
MLSDLLSDAGFEVHNAAKKQPYDLFFLDDRGKGVAIRCGVSVRARYIGSFRAWIEEAVSSLPKGISELWLVDVSFPPEVQVLAADYKAVQIWQLSALSERYRRGDGNSMDRRSSNALVGEVVKLLKSEGFRPMVSMDISGNAPVNLTFRAKDGTVIGIYCGRLSRLPNEEAVQDWIRHIEHEKHEVSETLIVNTYFPEYVRTAIDPFSGVEAVEFPLLAEWVQRYKKIPPVAQKKAAKPKKVAVRIKANKEQILLAIAALTASIDEKLEGLRRTKPNSDDAITAWETLIADYEKLRAQTLGLKEAVSKLSVSVTSQAKVEKKAGAFGKMMSSWMEKDGGKVLTTTANVGVFCLGALLCTLMNVAPEVAVGASAWVVTKKNPGKAMVKGAKAVGRSS